MFPALVFCVVYILIALLTPKVWSATSSPGGRLLGIIAVHIGAVIVAALAYMFVLFLMLGGVESADGLRAGEAAAGRVAARTVIPMGLLVVVFFFSSLGQWLKHGDKQDAKGSVGVARSGHMVFEVQVDPLKSELRKREEAEARDQRRKQLTDQIQSMEEERAILIGAAEPSGDPKRWSTQVLRAEVERRDRIEQITRTMQRLQRTLDAQTGSVSSAPPRGAKESRQTQSIDLKRRLAALEEWNRSNGG